MKQVVFLVVSAALLMQTIARPDGAAAATSAVTEAAKAADTAAKAGSSATSLADASKTGNSMFGLRQMATQVENISDGFHDILKGFLRLAR